MRRSRIIRSGSLSGSFGFLAALAFYGATLLPGVAFWDTGEMQTVPTILGIAHPTGFPLFVLGGWIFEHALPVGDPAWRLSLFSALASAGAAGLLAVFVTDVAEDALAGAGAALVFALGDVAWTRGVRADVHDLALLFVALALVAANRAGRAKTRASSRPLAVAALACGCGIAVHPIAGFVIPAVLLAAWPAIAALSPRTVFAITALGFVPLALYAYVPLRSAYIEKHGLDPQAGLGVSGGAFWDNEAPASAASFGRYVTGAAFTPQGSFFAAVTPRGIAALASFASRTLFREYSLLALALSLGGFTYLAIRRPRLALGLASLGVCDAAFAANYGAESDTARYLLGGLWATAAFAGIGAWWLATAIAGEEREWVASLGGCALLVAALALTAPAAARDLTRERRLSDARPYIATIERLTAPDSLVVATWTFASPLAYETYVRGTFGRRLFCGWPRDETTRVRAWRTRFGHVYFVTPLGYEPMPFARRIFGDARYVLSELRP